MVQPCRRNKGTESRMGQAAIKRHQQEGEKVDNRLKKIILGKR
jgi:hypothetical protein